MKTIDSDGGACCPTCGAKRLVRVDWSNLADFFRSIKTAERFLEIASLTREQILAAAGPVPELRIQTGIYFLLKGDEIVYVGKSEFSVLQRISQHQSEKDFDRVAFLPIKHGRGELINLAEAYLIKLLDPPLNRAMKPKPGFVIEDWLAERKISGDGR